MACNSSAERRGKKDGMPGGEEVGGLFDRGRRAVNVGAMLAMSFVAFGELALVTVAPEIAGDLGVGERIGPSVLANHPRPAELALYGQVCGGQRVRSLHEI